MHSKRLRVGEGVPLFFIVSIVYSFPLARLDFNSPSKKDSNLKIFGLIESALLVRAKNLQLIQLCNLRFPQKSSHLKRPRVFLTPDVAKDAKLKDIVKEHNGVLVASASQASHVVVPEVPTESDENPDLDYLRTLERRGKNALVHWWYYPDSYDTWLPTSEVEVSESTCPVFFYICDLWQLRVRVMRLRRKRYTQELGRWYVPCIFIYFLTPIIYSARSMVDRFIGV